MMEHDVATSALSASTDGLQAELSMLLNVAG